MTTVILIAKQPIPGRVKTRLHPPLSLEQAAELAAASIDDTLAALEQLPATRRVLAFDGAIVPDAAGLYDVIPQVEGGLDARLGAIFDECSGPTVLVGMDTPQLSAHDLAPVFADWPAGTDAWIGLANDGGFWALALWEPNGDLIRGVALSRDDTAELQIARLRDAGLTVGFLPTLTDVDTIDDALEVAGTAPATRFARTLASFDTASFGVQSALHSSALAAGSRA